MAHHRRHQTEDEFGSFDFGSIDGGSDRVLDLVNQKEVAASGSRGTVSLAQMAHVFRLFQPDEDQMITADSVCNFLRLKLGYRPDPILIASLFSDLNRRVTGGDDMAKASASSHPARRAAAAAATASVGADETEMHLNTFISAIRGASTPHTAYSDHGGGLDPELDELMRSFDLMSESGGKSSVEESPRGLLSVAQLHHRLRVCRGDKLSESEFASLIEFAGTVDRNGRPISEAAAAGSEVFIPYKSFVNKLANNKPGGDV